jgi:hypothetical protein
MTVTKEMIWISIFFWVSTAGLFWLVSPLFWTALRTGRLLARGRIYDRDDSPGMYWGGIVFWMVVCSLMLCISLFLVWDLTSANNPH